jgi:uncharacterized protein YdeI (BOF family)
MKFATLFGIAFAALATSTIPTLVSAQTQPGNVQRVSIEISGKIISIDDGDFLLDTSNGQILVDADDRSVRRANLTVGEQVTVTGRYDDDSFDAYTVTRESGEVVSVWD